MSPASCLTAAGALALLITSTVEAGATMRHGARMPFALHVHRNVWRPPLPVSVTPAPKPWTPPPVSHHPRPHVGPSPLAPQPGPEMPHVQFRHPHVWGPRLIHVDRRGGDRRFGRGFRQAGIYAVGSVAPTYYSDAPAVTAYAPAEPPLVYAYGAPPLVYAYGEPPLAPRVSCTQPAVHYIKKVATPANLPKVIYGVQPPCGLPRAAAAPERIRAAY